jgi:hypothetical protein
MVFIAQFTVCRLKNVDIKVHETVILPVVLRRYETWSSKLRNEHRLRVFEKTVPRRIFERRRDEVTGVQSNCLIKSFIFYTIPRILLG